MSSKFWYLLGRKLADEATLDEIRELQTFLLENPDVASRVEIHAEYLKKLSSATSGLQNDEIAWQKQLAKMKEIFPDEFETGKNISVNTSKKRRFSNIRILSIAAACIFVICIAAFYFFYNSLYSEKLLTGKEGKIETTAFDKVRNVLPDGSVVWLNSNSRITYNKEFGKTNRDISLTGEAFFDVAHKAELPMIVHAGGVNIKVKGTAFNVMSYPNDDKVEAVLIRGSIELTTVLNDRTEKILMKPNEKVVVAVAVADKKNHKRYIIGALKLDTLNVEANSGLIPEVAWIQNKIVFVNEPFGDLAKRMGRWYNINITIEDSTLLNERFTGAFENETLEEALGALQFTYNFKYRMDQNKILITKQSSIMK